MNESKRQYKRLDKTITLKFCVEDQLPHKWEQSVVENISMGGVKFIAPSDWQLNNKVVNLQIKIQELAPYLLEIQALVVDIKPRKSPASIDIRAKFVNISELNKQQLQVVEKMIAEHDAKEAKRANIQNMYKLK